MVASITNVGLLRGERLLAAAALLAGAVFGQAGGMAGPGVFQNIAYAVSSVGLVVGAALLALLYQRRGSVVVAAGFLVLAIAEVMLWAGGTPSTTPAYESTFAGGVMFYAPALLLTGAPADLSWPVRALAILAAVPWAVHTYRFLVGQRAAIDSPVVIAGYVLLALTIIGWVVELVRTREEAA